MAKKPEIATETEILPETTQNVVSEQPQDAPTVVRVRLKSLSNPYRRGGFVFPTADDWYELEVDKTSPDATNNFIAWVEDPNVKVEIMVLDEWVAVNKIPEAVKEYFEALGFEPPK